MKVCSHPSCHELLLLGYVVSRQELVGHLQQQIAEQKRIDLSTSGIPIQSDVYQLQNIIASKDTPGNTDVQLLLPGDTKKQRKQVKQIFLDRGANKRSHYCSFDMDICLSLREGRTDQICRPGRLAYTCSRCPNVPLRCHDQEHDLDNR